MYSIQIYPFFCPVCCWPDIKIDIKKTTGFHPIFLYFLALLFSFVPRKNRVLLLFVVFASSFMLCFCRFFFAPYRGFCFCVAAFFIVFALSAVAFCLCFFFGGGGVMNVGLSRDVPTRCTCVGVFFHFPPLAPHSSFSSRSSFSSLLFVFVVVAPYDTVVLGRGWVGGWVGGGG